VSVVTQPIPLSQIAAELGLEVTGDGRFVVSGVAALDTAGPGDLAFVRSARFAKRAANSKAGALILPLEWEDPGGRPALRSTNPGLDFARVVEHFAPAIRPEPGRHPSAQVAEDAVVDGSAFIDAGAVVGSRSRVGARTVVHPNVTLYPDVVVGRDCELHAGVVLREGSVLGDRVTLQPGVVIGGDGFGYVADEQGAPRRVPQLGTVSIEDDVEIGANTTIDRASFDRTRIRRGAKIDNGVMIAHGCDIGENVIVVAQTGLSGSTVVGDGAILMARVGSTGHLRIGEGAFVGAGAGLHKDVAPDARVFGAPALEERHWHRTMAALARLPKALRRLRAVERALGIGPRREEESDLDD